MVLYLNTKKPRNVWKVLDGYEKNMSQWSYSMNPYRTILPVQIRSNNIFPLSTQWRIRKQSYKKNYSHISKKNFKISEKIVF